MLNKQTVSALLQEGLYYYHCNISCCLCFSAFIVYSSVAHTINLSPKSPSFIEAIQPPLDYLYISLPFGLLTSHPTILTRINTLQRLPFPLGHLFNSDKKVL